MSLDVLLANVTEVKKVRLDAGDVLFVKVDDYISQAAAADIQLRVQAILREKGVDVPILVLDRGTDIEVVHLGPFDTLVNKAYRES